MQKRKIKIRTLMMVVMIISAVILVSLSTLMFGELFSSGFRAQFVPDGHHSGYITVVDVEQLLLEVGFKVAAVGILFSVCLAFLVSRWLSKDVLKSVDSAKSITDEKFVPISNSKIQEFDNLNDTLIDINTRLNIKNQNRKNIYDQLYHQSRTPLTIMKNILEGIEDGVVEMDDDEIRVCQNQVENLQELIDNMELMIDGSYELVKMRLESFDLRDIIKKIVSGYQRQFNQKGIELKINNDQITKVYNDRFKISQSIYNLVNNAFKYTNPGGTVELDYYSEDDKAIIKVKDTGIGITKSELEHIFKAFYRGEGVSMVPGEGIGLYMLKENIEACQGLVRVMSTPGEGTLFTIEIPIHYQEG